MDKLPALLLSIPLILFVSGCTFVPVEVTSNGVEIESFTSDFSNVHSGEIVLFRMLVRNTGSADATDVFAEALGIDNDWYPEDIEKPPNEPECWWNGQHFTLIAPDTVNNVPGQAHQCTWTYTAPQLSSGQSITYEVTGRVFYHYSSSTVTAITFGTYDEIRELQDSGQALPAQITTSSEGPIKMDIQSVGPIRFMEGESSVEFPLYITIQNLGGGTVCSVDSANDCKQADNQNKVDVSFASNNINFEGCDVDGFSMWGGSNSYSCKATATGLPQIMTQSTITATAEYSYYSDEEISVTVTGI